MSEPTSDRLRTLCLADFEPYVGQDFAFRTAGGKELGTRLDHGRPLGGQAIPGAERAPFALIFVAERTEVLPQQTVSLCHETLGTLDLFVVPVGPDRQGRMQYEAVFT
jgi:Domain of unknown function (DUF6916)